MRGQDGYTILEALIAMVILSVGIMAWVVTQGQNIRSRSISGNIAQATVLAQSRQEVLSSQVQEWGSDHADVNGSVSETLEGVTYTVSWTVTGTELLDGGPRSWKVVTMVNWGKWGTHSVTSEKVVSGK